MAEGWVLEPLQGEFAVCRIAPTLGLPMWCIASDGLLSWTRTDGEGSIVCRASLVPEGVTSQRGLQALRVRGPVGFSVTGVLASLTRPLAAIGVSVFAISTFDTDYLLYPQTDEARVKECLARSGFAIADASC